MTDNKLYNKTESMCEFMLNWANHVGNRTIYLSEAINEVRTNWIEFFVPDQHKYLYNDKFSTLFPDLGLLFTIKDLKFASVAHTFTAFDYMYYLNILMIIDNTLYNHLFFNIFILFIIWRCIRPFIGFFRSKSVSRKDRNIVKLLLFLLLLVYVFVYRDYAGLFFPFEDTTSYRTLKNAPEFYRYFFFKRVCMLTAVLLFLLYLFAAHFYYIEIDTYVIYWNLTRSKYYINLEDYKFYTKQRIAQNDYNRFYYRKVFFLLIFFIWIVITLLLIALVTLTFFGFFRSESEMDLSVSFTYYKVLYTMECTSPTMTYYPMSKINNLWILEYYIKWLFESTDSLNLLTFVNTLVLVIRSFSENSFIESFIIHIFGDLGPIHNNYFYKLFHWILGSPEFLFVFFRELFKEYLNLFWCTFNVIHYYIDAELLATMHDYSWRIKEINTGLDEYFRINHLRCDTYIIYEGDRIKYYDFDQVRAEKLQRYTFFRRKQVEFG